MHSYLALIPRGLEHVAKDVVVQTLREAGDWNVQVHFRGELPAFPGNDACDTELVGLERGTVARRTDSESGGSNRLRRSGEGGRSAQRGLDSSTCARRVGVVKLDGTRDVAFGYVSRPNQPIGPNDTGPMLVWSEPGQLRGLVWVEISTSAPVELVTVHLRCLGSLLVLVDVWDKNEAVVGNGMEASQTLEEGASSVQKIIEHRQAGYGEAFCRALELWLECVEASWDLPSHERLALRERMTGTGESPFTYRISCLRDSSKRYNYSRQEFLEKVAGWVVPFTRMPTVRTWRVDMAKHDLEIVVLVRPNAIAIGFAVRPYQRLSTKTFSAGVLPPEVSPPYLSGGVLSGLVRLRPSTSQLLLHLARLRPGDVLLDPCAGVGTIPAETLLPGAVPVVAIGGDLVLNAGGFGPLAASYVADARSCQRRWYPNAARSAVAEFVGADAACLPLRGESVDVVVSDLPFGQLCLSSAKLSGLVPLLVSELARVLRRGSGRAVLLCGSCVPILTAMKEENSRSGRLVWELPCDSVFPVNIGGFQGWVIQARRACDEPVPIPNHRDRVRKIAIKREMMLRSRPETNPSRRLQS